MPRYNTAMTHEDHVSIILAQWAAERPDLDVSPMGIVGRISRLALVVDKELEPVFARFGLNHWSFDMLATLRRAGAPYRLSPTELFRSMMVTSGTMTNRIDRLAEKGLVRRVPDPEDRRGILVELTEQGRELIDGVLIWHVANEARLLQSLSKEERHALAVLLRKLLSSLEDHSSVEA
jgi:DNA-binding MarR family transcriptional regulator